LVVTCEDLIAYDNPAYFRSFGDWDAHRGLTRASLTCADRVVFSSARARADALAEDLLDPARASVVPFGVEGGLHRLPCIGVPACPPCGADRLPEGFEVMVCFGSDRRHENRVFALSLLQQLQLRHDWRGVLVLAGPRVAQGSSAADEGQVGAVIPERLLRYREREDSLQAQFAQPKRARLTGEREALMRENGVRWTSSSA